MTDPELLPTFVNLYYVGTPTLRRWQDLRSQQRPIWRPAQPLGADGWGWVSVRGVKSACHAPAGDQLGVGALALARLISLTGDALGLVALMLYTASTAGQAIAVALLRRRLRAFAALPVGRHRMEQDPRVGAVTPEDESQHRRPALTRSTTRCHELRLEY